jgi:hypothetical protein
MAWHQIYLKRIKGNVHRDRELWFRKPSLPWKEKYVKKLYQLLIMPVNATEDSGKEKRVTFHK